MRLSLILTAMCSVLVTAAKPAKTPTPPSNLKEFNKDDKAELEKLRGQIYDKSRFSYEKRFNVLQTHYWGVDKVGPCKPLSIMWAAGENQKGNVGDWPAKAFFAELAWFIGEDDFAAQGMTYVTYNRHGNKAPEPQIAELNAKLLMDVKERCPNTTMVLVGDGQGAKLIRAAALALSKEDAYYGIAAAILFSDIDWKDDVHGLPNNRVHKYCVESDWQCHKKPAAFHYWKIDNFRFRHRKVYNQPARRSVRWLLAELGMIPGVVLEDKAYGTRALENVMDEHA